MIKLITQFTENLPLMSEKTANENLPLNDVVRIKTAKVA